MVKTYKRSVTIETINRVNRSVKRQKSNIEESRIPSAGVLQVLQENNRLLPGSGRSLERPIKLENKHSPNKGSKEN